MGITNSCCGSARTESELRLIELEGYVHGGDMTNVSEILRRLPGVELGFDRTRKNRLRKVLLKIIGRYDELTNNGKMGLIALIKHTGLVVDTLPAVSENFYRLQLIITLVRIKKYPIDFGYGSKLIRLLQSEDLMVYSSACQLITSCFTIRFLKSLDKPQKLLLIDWFHQNATNNIIFRTLTEVVSGWLFGSLADFRFYLEDHKYLQTHINHIPKLGQQQYQIIKLFIANPQRPDSVREKLQQHKELIIGLIDQYATDDEGQLLTTRLEKS